MEALDRLLAELFESHGFRTTPDAALEGRSGTVYGAPVLAEDERGAFLVERRGADDPVGAAQVAELLAILDDTGADHAVLVHLGPRTPDAVAAARRRVTFWDRTTLERLVGSATVAQIAGLRAEALPLAVDPPGAPTELGDLLPDAFQDEAPTAHLDLDMFESLAAAIPPGPPPPRQAPPTASRPALAPRIDRARAVALARDRLFTVDAAALVLQPVHLFDYECDLLIEGSLRYDTVRGRLEVHGTAKTVRDVDPLLLEPAKAGPLPRGLPVEDEKALRVTPERAVALAHAHLMETHTRVVEIETADEDGDVSVMEHKKVAPRPDQVRIEPLGVLDRPLWRLRGTNGVVLVDGLTGECVGEELRTYDPDVMIVD